MFTLTSPCFSSALPMDSLPKLRHSNLSFYHHPSPLLFPKLLSFSTSNLSFSSSSFRLPSIKPSSSPFSSSSDDDKSAFYKPRNDPSLVSILQTLLFPELKVTCIVAVVTTLFFLRFRYILRPVPSTSTLEETLKKHNIKVPMIFHKPIVKVLDLWTKLIPEGSDSYMFDGNDTILRMMYQDILKKDPLDVKAYHGLETLTLKQSNLEGLLKRVQEAAETCKKLKKEDSHMREFRLLIAKIKLKQENYSEALEAYQNLVEEDPTDFRPYYWLSVIYSLRGSNDEAQKQFDKFHRLAPKDHPYNKSFKTTTWPCSF